MVGGFDVYERPNRLIEELQEGSLIRRLAAQYGELLSRISQSGGISPRLVDYRIRAGIPEFIVTALLVRGPSNVSEFARWARQQRGRASRDKIRKELNGLIESKIVRFDASTRKYVLTPDFVASYIKLLLGDASIVAGLLDAAWGKGRPLE